MLQRKQVYVEVYEMGKKYDYKKTLIKGVKIVVPVIIAGIASVYGDNPIYLALVPIIAMISNTLKHKYKTDLKVV